MIDSMNSMIPVPDLLLYDEGSHRSTMDCSINYITSKELNNILESPLAHSFDSIILLDARFTYEYIGGHIYGAINITKNTDFERIYQKYQYQNVCIICYCEYSQNRGPGLYFNIRSYDRIRHLRDYPALSFPNLFVLEGGYRKLFAEYPLLCKGGYVKMREYKYRSELKKCNSALLREKEKLSMSQGANIDESRSASDLTCCFSSEFFSCS